MSLISSTCSVQKCAPLSLKQLLSLLPHPLVVLKSSGQGASDRYSLYCFSPLGWIKGVQGMTVGKLRGKRCSWKQPLHQVLKELFPRDSRALDFPFTGGAVGFFSYEYGAHLDRFAFSPNPFLLHFPLGFFYIFDHVLIVDELESAAYLVHRSSTPVVPFAPRSLLEKGEFSSLPLSPRFDLRQDAPRLFSARLAPEIFCQKVQKVQQAIQEGEVYQANISILFEAEGAISPRELFSELMEHNPAPFAFYMEAPSFSLISCSPERLLLARGSFVESLPIAGTYPRRGTEREDRAAKRELLSSCKERAEHLMLVDLVRNDLGKVCEVGSVQVDDLAFPISTSHVHHIVSRVTGRLPDFRHGIDAWADLFPGGTITGCPKIRATELIAELEERRRHFYTGSFGYVDACGNLDFNIMIRTILSSKGRFFSLAGAGIVSDSSPEREYEEVLHKQAALSAALGASRSAAGFLGADLPSPSGGFSV